MNIEELLTSTLNSLASVMKPMKCSGLLKPGLLALLMTTRYLSS